MLGKLGYVWNNGAFSHPAGRKVIHLGDICDRGNDPIGTLSIVLGMARNGSLLCVLGNHCDKLLRFLKGNKITPSHGLSETITALETQTPEFRAEVLAYLETLPIELTLDNGKLSCSHAGLDSELQGKTTSKARSRALFGKTTGKKDEHGYPERIDWAQDYKGTVIVCHGHTPMEQVRCLNNVWCLDQGCCFGGSLTCLRYPEMEIVQVPAARNYSGINKFGNGE